MASALVRCRIHALLSGNESEEIADVPHELEPLALLLDECKDLLQFREAEHAADYKDMQLTQEYLRDQLTAQEAATKSTSTLEEQRIELQHERFNYALALEAITVLQGDPDETCVEKVAPMRTSESTVEQGIDSPGSKTYLSSELLEQEKQQILQEAETKYSKLLALQQEEFAYAQQEQAKQHTGSLEALNRKHANEMQTLRTEHNEFVDSLRHESAVKIASEHAQHLKEQDALRRANADALERLFTEKQQELRAAQSTHNAALEKAMVESQIMHDTQYAKHEALQRDLVEKLTYSEQHNSKLSAELKVYAKRTQSITEALDALLASVQENEILLDSVQSRIDTYQEFEAEALQQKATLEQNIAKQLSHISHLEETNSDLQTKLEENEFKLKDLHDTERRLCELQRELEQTHEVQADVDALQQRAEHAESALSCLREQLRESEELRVKVAQLQSEAEELQTVVSMHRTNAQHVEQERVQANDQIQELIAKVYVLEHTLRERDDEVSSLRSARTRHIDQIRNLRNTEKALRAGNDSNEWQEKVTQLELELTAKAQEVEEADTRILTALRDNKRLVSQNRLLQSKIVQMKQAAESDKKSDSQKHIFQDRTNYTPSNNEQHSVNSPVKSPVKSPMKPPVKVGRSDAQFRDRLARFKPN
ncbi:hypothetical protein MPSI1_002922 [Malassezia psittaci]|uniref:Uncharacterized protein n=1 Tax=Malassezia psittaci TaxID=1821823 RepID=A0AAF0F6V9_9BASI|nr:hypothetical protein MPSI1_002922 [Malassezia psittaci]